MAPRTSATSVQRHVTIIGHNSQIVPTVAFFVGGGIAVHVFTCDSAIEIQLAIYPGVLVTLVPTDYPGRPAGLPPPPYVVVVDRPDLAARIRAWLPPTVAAFLVSNDQRRRRPEGYLQLMPKPEENRRDLARRLAILRRVDDLVLRARSAKAPIILMYGDPDPDAIGSALGLATLWRAFGAQPAIRHMGEVQRYQNKLLLAYLKQPIAQLEPDELANADLVAVVDCQPGFWKTNPPLVHVVIDHHPLREDTVGEFIDVREQYGATCTMIAEYLIESGVGFDRKLATALIYGIISDTDELQRHASSADVRAYDHLLARADRHFLARLAKSQVPMAMLDYIAWGIAHRVVCRDMIVVHFGAVPTPDVMVQAADLILLTCGITWVACAGVHDDRLIVIFRGDGHHQDVGRRAALAFAKLGSAGGHRTMGRAEIPLKGEHVDTTVELLVDNLFKRMSPARRRDFVRTLRNHLHGAGPADPDEARL